MPRKRPSSMRCSPRPRPQGATAACSTRRRTIACVPCWRVVDMTDADTLPVLSFATQHAWEAWLDERHADAPGVWLKIAKKAAASPSVSYAEALEGALCYGWIDGQKAPFDDQHWLQKFTPRRAKSGWSRVNCAKAMALIAAGRMRPAGLRQVEQARADGRWDGAYEAQRTIAVPPHLPSQLTRRPAAQEFFGTAGP